MRNGNTPVICFLSSAVCPPHHFTAKRVKENMIKAFYYFDTVICPADSELGGFFARFTSAVNGNEEVMAAAFHVQCDFPIVSDNDRTDVEAMRSYGSNNDGVGMGHHDRDRLHLTNRRWNRWAWQSPAHQPDKCSGMRR